MLLCCRGAVYVLDTFVVPNLDLNRDGGELSNVLPVLRSPTAFKLRQEIAAVIIADVRSPEQEAIHESLLSRIGKYLQVA